MTQKLITGMKAEQHVCVSTENGAKEHGLSGCKVKVWKFSEWSMSSQHLYFLVLLPDKWLNCMTVLSLSVA